MKTKRTIFSIVVFLSVYWISILAGFKLSFNKESDVQVNESLTNKEVDSDEAYEAGISSIADEQGSSMASTGSRLYQSDNSEPKADKVSVSFDPLIEDDATDEAIEEVTEEAEDENFALLRAVSQDISQEPPQAASLESSTESLAEASLDSSLDSSLENDLTQDPSSDEVSARINVSSISNVALLHYEEPEVKPAKYADIGISIADSYVNIRAKATTESEILGKLYKNSAAKILDTVGDWYYVESGSVKGYVNTAYIKTGIPDEELIEKYSKLRALIDTDGLNVREKPDIESKKLTVVYQNETYPVIDVSDEWLKLDITDERIIGYVKREYVELLVDFEKAISKEEEEEIRKLQEEERMKRETQVKYRDEVAYTEEELKLLACLVHSEAGDQSYEGKLAVANIVLNRVKSKQYPNTIKDVIYQPGQFTVAKNGSLAKQLERYESYSSTSQLLTIKAAKAALSGANNIGNRLYFHTYKLAVKKGYDKKKNAVKIQDHLFW